MAGDDCGRDFVTWGNLLGEDLWGIYPEGLSIQCDVLVSAGTQGLVGNSIV